MLRSTSPVFRLVPLLECVSLPEKREKPNVCSLWLRRAQRKHCSPFSVMRNPGFVSLQQAHSRMFSLHERVRRTVHACACVHVF